MSRYARIAWTSFSNTVRSGSTRSIRAKRKPLLPTSTLPSQGVSTTRSRIAWSLVALDAPPISDIASLTDSPSRTRNRAGALPSDMPSTNCSPLEARCQNRRGSPALGLPGRLLSVHRSRLTVAGCRVPLFSSTASPEMISPESSDFQRIALGVMNADRVVGLARLAASALTAGGRPPRLALGDGPSKNIASAVRDADFIGSPQSYGCLAR